VTGVLLLHCCLFCCWLRATALPLAVCCKRLAAAVAAVDVNSDHVGLDVSPVRASGLTATLPVNSRLQDHLHLTGPLRCGTTILQAVSYIARHF
jgi:hypothetical protein